MENAAFDPQMCRQCGGRCCQGHPGVWVDPHRFSRLFFDGIALTIPMLDEELPKRGLVLRDFLGVPVPAPMRNEEGCTFLSADGCRFTEEERPCQCLALVPSIDTLMDGEMNCTMPSTFGSGTARDLWNAYWHTKELKED